MPFSLLSLALGICFLLVWAIIGGMIFRDGQLAVRRELEADANILPLSPPRPNWPGLQKSPLLASGGQPAVRAAS